MNSYARERRETVIWNRREKKAERGERSGEKIREERECEIWEEVGGEGGASGE